MPILAKSYVGFLASLVILLLVASCSPTPTAAPTSAAAKATSPPQSAAAEKEQPKVPSGEPIKLGGASPLTGPFAEHGEYVRRAVVQAVDEINEKGGILGRPVQLLYEDDKGDPKEAVSVASKLVNAGVVAVVGHWNSASSIPASVVYDEAKVISISPGSTNPQLTEQGFKYVFRTAGRTDRGVGLLAAKYAVEVLGKKKAADLNDKSSFGQGLAEDFQGAFTKLGGQVLAFEAVTAGERDFTPILTKFKGLNPDVIYYGGYHAEAGLIAKQMKALKIDATLIGAPELYAPMFLDIAGSAAEGTVVPAGPSCDVLPNCTSFIERYHTKYQDDSTEWALHGYDAVNIIAAAIKSVGSTDREKVRDAVAATKGFPGVFGSITFDEKGDVLDDPNVIYIRKDGKWLIDAFREGKWVHIRQ